MNDEKQGRQAALKPHYTEDAWRMVTVPLNDTLIKLISNHLRDTRETFDLSDEYRELAWLIDEKRLAIERKLIRSEPKKLPAKKRQARKTKAS
jgi:hypothetical protein